MDIQLSNPFQAEDFLKLRNEWYDKLERSGFEDIEKTFKNDATTTLNRLHSSWFGKNDPDQMVFSRDYYYIAAQFLNEHVFEKQEHKQVWELHTAGLSFRRIAQALSSESFRYTKERVEGIVNDLKKHMKKWKCENL